MYLFNTPANPAPIEHLLEQINWDYFSTQPIPDNREFFVPDHLLRYLERSRGLGNGKFICTCGKSINVEQAKAHYISHFGEFFCLHCAFDGSKIEKMKKHMVTRHADKLLFIGVRQYRPDRDPCKVRNEKEITIAWKEVSSILSLIFLCSSADWQFQNREEHHHFEHCGTCERGCSAFPWMRTNGGRNGVWTVSAKGGLQTSDIIGCGKCAENVHYLEDR